MVRTVFLVVLLYLWSPLRGVTDITCPYMSSCVLPCFFDHGPEVVIHWLCPPEVSSKTVHTYYHKKDQLGNQKPQYKGRTALVKEEILKGNASLMLSRTKVTDSGKYKCYTSTTKGNQEKIINMNVQAPVADVMLLQEGDELMCRSEEVFPKPIVTWSPSMHANTTVKETENNLYNIISSVTLSEHTAQEYTCNVSTHYSWRSATYRKNDPLTASEFKATIPCGNIKTSKKSLLWTFNNTQTILNRTGSEPVNESWRKFVDGVTESGSLVLKSITSDQQGLYCCVLKTDTNTYMTRTEVYVHGESIQPDHMVVIIAVVACIAVLVLLVIGVVLLKRRSAYRPVETNPQQTSQETTERTCNHNNGNHIV